jgi:hypothetical protein
LKVLSLQGLITGGKSTNGQVLDKMQCNNASGIFP